LSVGNPSLLATAFVTNQSTVPVGEDAVQLVPANTSRVALIVSNNGDHTVWLNPSVPVASGTGIELGPVGSGRSTEKFYFHNVGGVVGDGWYGITESTYTSNVRVYEVLYRPE
jgi:hypothetical protein